MIDEGWNSFNGWDYECIKAIKIEEMYILEKEMVRNEISNELVWINTKESDLKS